MSATSGGRRAAIAVGVALAVLGATADARAQSAQAAAAESAFSLGRRLLAEGRAEEACAAFRESMRLEQATGTLYNIGLCSEASGKTATAWSAFKAVGADEASNPERARTARERAAALEPKLSRLRLQAAIERPGSVVDVDGVSIGTLVLREGVAVDPGTHALVLRAEGYQPWRGSVTVPSTASTTVVHVPALEPLPPPPPPVKPRSATPGWITAGAGVAVLGAGITTGILALGAASDAKACGPCVRGSPEARDAADAYDRGIVLANVTNVLVPVGAIATGVGVWLVLRARARPTSSVVALPGEVATW